MAGWEDIPDITTKKESISQKAEPIDWDKIPEPEKVSWLAKTGKGIKEYATDPQKVGRLFFQATGGFAGGTLGSALPIYGTIVGGTLGFAFGDQLADIVYGERLPPEKAGKPVEQLKQVGVDFIKGFAYEGIGAGMALGGRALYGAELGVKAAIKEGIKPAITRKFDELATKQAAKEIARQTSKTPEITKRIEEITGETEKLEKEITGLKFNIGQRGGDPNLLSLARQKGQAPGAGSEFSQFSGTSSIAKQNEALTNYIDLHIRRNGNIDDFLMEIQKEKERLAVSAKFAASKGEIEAQKLIGKSDQEIGERFLEKIKDLKGLDKAEAKKLYENVPDDLKIDATPLWNKVDELFGSFDALTQRLGSTPTGTMSRVKQAMGGEKSITEAIEKYGLEPSKIVDKFGKELLQKESLPPQLTMKQIKDFRSNISTSQRIAVGSKDFELSYKLGQLKDGVSETLSIATKEGSEEGIKALEKATEFWKNVYVPKYRYGVTGKILGIEKTGEQKIADSLIASKYFKKGKEGIAEAADSYKLTFGNDAEAKSLIRDYASQSLLKDARNPVTAELESKRVALWLHSHEESLRRFGLKEEFGSLKKALKIVDESKALESQFNSSSLAKALGVDPEKAINEALMIGTGRKQSIKRLKEMVALARKDQTGAATEGLKAGIGDYFKNEMLITTRDLADRKITSLAKMDKFIKNYKPALKESGLYTEKELKSFDYVHNSLIAIARQQRPHADFANSSTYDLISRGLASGVSVASGHIGLYGTVMAATRIFTKQIQDKIDFAASRAIFDPRYADAISGLAFNIKKTSTQKALEIFNRRLEVLGGMVGVKSIERSE